ASPVETPPRGSCRRARPPRAAPRPPRRIRRARRARAATGRWRAPPSAATGTRRVAPALWPRAPLPWTLAAGTRRRWMPAAHAPGHDHGSSHGGTRIIRLGYFEHPSYVPLLRRAYALWRQLEAASGRRLLHITGIAEIGPRDSTLVRGTLAAAQLHALPHEVL